jgi:hypothetical protein
VLDDLDVTDYATSPANPTGQPLQVSVNLGAEGSGTVSFYTLLSAVGGSATVAVSLVQSGSTLATQTFSLTSTDWLLARVDVPATSVNWTQPVTVNVAPTVS